MRWLPLSLCAALVAATGYTAPEPGAAPAPAKAAAPASPPAPDVPPPDPALFQQAKAEVLAKRWESAVEPLFAYFAAAPMTDEHRPYAELHLAEALMALGLKHAAAVFFADLVAERSQPEAVPPAVEGLRSLVKGAHDELLID